MLLCKTLKPNGKSSGNLWVAKTEKELNNLDLHSLPVTIGNFTNSFSQKLFEGKLVAHFGLIIQVKGFSVKDLMLNTGGKFLNCVFDTECNLTRLSFLSCARNEIASNSKYVVCFKKYFAGKGGLYEFIMLCNMRA